jgi:hypothetical protein
MADTACGYNRLPIGDDWTPEQVACERAAWELFASSCGGCANPSCVAQLWAQYQNSRAQCLHAESCCGG